MFDLPAFSIFAVKTGKISTLSKSIAYEFDPLWSLTTPDGLDELYKLTLGLPREICKVTDMALLRAMVNDTHEINADIVRQTAEQLAVHEQEATAVTDKPAKPKPAVNSQNKESVKPTLWQTQAACFQSW